MTNLPPTPAQEQAQTQIRERMIQGAFTVEMGLQADGAGSGWATVSVELGPRHMNRNAIAHGGVVVTLLDTASGLACIFDDDGAVIRKVVTVSLNTHFLRPVSEGRLLATARVESGRRTLSVSSTCVDAQGRLVASGQGIFQTVTP
jgi:uncharacterized protein (TIGR00369 family)